MEQLNIRRIGEDKKRGTILFTAIFLITQIFSQSVPDNNRHFLLRDEGLSQLSYIDLAKPANNWFVPISTGRDIQLVGKGIVLIGTDSGYEEHEISTGKKIYEVTSFPGTISARRLQNGNTMLLGVNWHEKKGIVLVEINANTNIQRIIVYPGYNYARLLRETASGNFLITADEIVIEGNTKGDILWQAKITGKEKPHAWQAIRLANGQTLVSTGYAANLQLFAADGSFINNITGPVEVKPNFYAGLQVLSNGNYVVINWEGHGPGHGAIGTQLLEYAPNGKLVWSWQQDATKFSSLHAVIILDGLDTNQLHIENENGVLAPVKIIRQGIE